MLQDDLQGLVLQVSQAKKELKKAKEVEDKLSSQLKSELSAMGLSKQAFEEIGVKVSYLPTVKSIMNEDLLLNILKDVISNTSNEDIKENVQKCIKLVEQVDEEKVTELVYSGMIDVEDIAPAYEEKVSRTLRVGDIK